MKILAIGSKGMLGQATLDVWADHDVIGLDRPEIDITDSASIRRRLDEYRPEVVINCAAYTAVDQCETDESAADLVNGTAVGYLAKACDIQKIPIVHISTDYVFAGTKADGYQENNPTAPLNAYGRTKEHGERQLFLNTKRAYLVRTSWLYGPHGKNFVQTMLELGRSKPRLQVVHDQHGKPTYTHDLAGFIKSLLIDRAPYGIYHGVNEDVTTWYDFTVAIFQGANIQTPVSPCDSTAFPRPAARPAWSSLINTKRPLLRPWPEALRDYLSELGYGE